MSKTNPQEQLRIYSNVVAGILDQRLSGKGAKLKSLAIPPERMQVFGFTVPESSIADIKSGARKLAARIVKEAKTQTITFIPAKLGMAIGRPMSHIMVSESGIEIRAVCTYNLETDKLLCRFDVLVTFCM